MNSKQLLVIGWICVALLTVIAICEIVHVIRQPPESDFMGIVREAANLERDAAKP